MPKVKRVTMKNVLDAVQDVGESVQFLATQVDQRFNDLDKKFATKDDLKAFATKDDLKKALAPFLTKDEFYRAHDKLIDRIDQVAVSQKEHIRLMHS